MISALVLTSNEEAHIARCLTSLTWCDEIVIVDSMSTDKTKSIACAPGAPWASKLKWLERAWDGFKNQRNYSLDQAASDWVLVVDADEEVSPELAKRVETILKNPECKYFKVRRQEYFMGAPINHGIWNPSYQDRFFHKQGVRFVNDIHEYPKYPSPPLEIHEPIHHAPDFGPEKFLYKMNKYTSIEARNRVDQGQRTNLFKITMAFPAMFLKNYFYYGSYKDGAHGLIISVLEGISRAVRHIKMWQLQK